MSTDTYRTRDPEAVRLGGPRPGDDPSNREFRQQLKGHGREGIAPTRADLTAALLSRAGVSGLPWESNQQTLDALRSWSLIDVAREWIAAGSPQPEVARQKFHSPDAVRAAVSSGDLASFFDAAFGSTIQAGFASERDSTAGWTTSIDVPDFKSIESFILAQFGTLRRLPRGQKAEHVDFSLSAESWSVARYAAKFTVDEQDMLDDSALKMHLLAVKQLGAAARRLVPDLVYAKLLENPTLSADNTALFHGDHSNLGAGALSEANLETAISAIAGQTFTTRDGRAVHVNATPVALVVPPALAGEARKLVRVITLGDGQDLRVVSESRISATGVTDPSSGQTRTGSDSCWFLVAGPTAFPSIIIGAIDGSSPKLRSQQLKGEHGQFGMGWGIYLDIGCGVVDYRGVYFSTGAV